MKVTDKNKRLKKEIRYGKTSDPRLPPPPLSPTYLASCQRNSISDVTATRGSKEPLSHFPRATDQHDARTCCLFELRRRIAWRFDVETAGIVRWVVDMFLLVCCMLYWEIITSLYVVRCKIITGLYVLDSKVITGLYEISTS